MEHPVRSHSLFTDTDIFLFRSGRHYQLYRHFGSHTIQLDGRDGTQFSVWAPHAVQVSVIGEFNDWQAGRHVLYPRWDGSGIWEGFIDGLSWGTLYKYAIQTADGHVLEKSDPYAYSWEQNRQAASLISTTYYDWQDDAWLQQRTEKDLFKQPISVYELHLGSWMRYLHAPQDFLTYREIADRLIPYLQQMNFTHVELMPVMEHPYEPSWGYQITGFYAANSRFGSPQDLMNLIDQLHQHGIGVILDWVPSHFPGDANGLRQFDGTPLYEYADPRKGFHPEWSSYVFDYGRPEVRSFLISNAHFWAERYHADGLRVDAVTSMLHLDYAREEGQWEPNVEGTNVNLEALQFLRECNTSLKERFPHLLTVAEESSDFPKLTHPVEEGGVGFDMKWMMGWMHDTLAYFGASPAERSALHQKITFTGLYMFNEKYMIPLSHDEVVHGKASLVYKMPGDEWQKFANLRLLYLYMYTMPGAKLLFMGGEFAQTNEWRFAEGLSWHLQEHRYHRGIQDWVRELNYLFQTEPALYSEQYSWAGFQWLAADCREESVFAYYRKNTGDDCRLLVIFNAKDYPQEMEFTIEHNLVFEEVLNSDEERYGGASQSYYFVVDKASKDENRQKILRVQLPALGGLILKVEKKLTSKKIRSSKAEV